MGNQLKGCMDCNSKNTTTANLDKSKIVPKRMPSITSLKTPELRAKGLLDLHYSDLPEILIERKA